MNTKSSTSFVPTIIATEVHPPGAKYIAHLALPHLKRIKAIKAEWEAEAEEAWRQGYRHTHCWHGTRMVWSDDRDAICGPCELGMTPYEQALMIAHDQWHTFCQRQQLYKTMRQVATAMNMDLPDAISVDWMVEPIVRNGEVIF